MEIKLGFSHIKLGLHELDHVMSKADFVRWAWDYKHVTYDYKLIDQTLKATYYLRISGNVVEGKTEEHDTIVQLEEPHIGKHLFPHGIDYDAVIPSGILDTAKRRLAIVKEKIV